VAWPVIQSNVSSVACATVFCERQHTIAALRKAFKFWCDAEAHGLMRRPAPHAGKPGGFARKHKKREFILLGDKAIPQESLMFEGRQIRSLVHDI